MKYIVIIPDGMADEPIKDLDNKTPMDYAVTNNMNFLAQNGKVGLVNTIPEGMKPGSDIGNLSLMGYDPSLDYSGRASLEAANLGIDLLDDQIAFRCNLVTIRDNKMTDYSAGHILTKEAGIIVDSLNEGISWPGIKFYKGTGYRHILLMNTNHVQEIKELKCTPPHDILGEDITQYLPQGSQAEHLLKIMEKSKDILKNHPINQVRLDLKESPVDMIWLWGQGSRPKLDSFQKKFGINGSIISAVDLVKGIGKLIGLNVINVPGATGYYDTNYKGKAEYALESLKENDFVFIHIEAPDEAGHNGDEKAKIESIERIDKDILGPIINAFNREDDVRILVLPDHPTPVAKRTHTSDPVPFVMYGKGIDADGVNNFSEKTAKKKGLKFNNGEELIKFFIKKYL